MESSLEIYRGLVNLLAGAVKLEEVESKELLLTGELLSPDNTTIKLIRFEKRGKVLEYCTYKIIDEKTNKLEKISSIKIIVPKKLISLTQLLEEDFIYREGDINW